MSFSSNKIRFLVFFNLALAVLDRLSKRFMLNHSDFYQSDLIELKLFKNPKLYFWAVNSVFLYIAAGAVLLLLIFLFFRSWRQRNFLLMAGFSLIILGGLSNLFDRITFGYVIDWIRVFFLPISIFNIADTMIIVGILCPILNYFRGGK